MREYWANVRVLGLVEGAYASVGNPRSTRSDAIQAVQLSPLAPSFRIHVRLKPEGAPKWYASDANRRAWELMPGRARQGAELGFVVCYYGPDDEAGYWARNS